MRLSSQAEHAHPNHRVRPASEDGLHPIAEGATRFLVPDAIARAGTRARGAGTARDGVLFNPASVFARDVSVLCLAAVVRPGMQVLDGLTGIGARAARWRSEVPGDYSVHANDYSPTAAAIARRNFAGLRQIELTTRPLGAVLAERGFDFIEIDAAGTPVPFLDSACQALHAGGTRTRTSDPRYLLVTATDTMVLAGAQPEVCRRRYGAWPLQGELGHEVAVRILAGTIVCSAARYGLAAVPSLTYWRGHWYSAFIRLERDEAGANAALARMGWGASCDTCWDRRVVPGESAPTHCALCGAGVERAGPLWTGSLWDAALLDRMLGDRRPLARGPEPKRSLALWRQEADAPPLFYEVHAAASHLRHVGQRGQIPSLDRLCDQLTGRRFTCARTHFSTAGIRTDAPAAVVLELLCTSR